MGSLKPLLLVGIGVLGLGNLLHIIGLATPNWTTYSVLGNDVEFGPINSCVENSFRSKCDETDSEESDVQAVVAMIVLGMLAGLGAGAAALVVFVFTLLGKDRPSIFALAIVGLSGASFIFIIIGVIVWGAKVHVDIKDNVDADLEWSFALCIVGAILILGGGLLTSSGSRP